MYYCVLFHRTQFYSNILNQKKRISPENPKLGHGSHIDIISSLSRHQVVLENSCRADEHDCPFARASIELTNMLCDILKVGEPRESTYPAVILLFSI